MNWNTADREEKKSDKTIVSFTIPLKKKDKQDTAKSNWELKPKKKRKVPTLPV